MTSKTSKPNDISALLSQADKARGFPAGTMASIMQQETGGNAKYLTDPTAYHYGLNAEGRRIAGHTGKISTAFGPFGILESTGADPGYGVKPLQNKSIEEQVRFASDYLDARSKSAGSLHAGLSGYGEGAKYATQVSRRRDENSPPLVPAAPPEVQLAQAAPPVQAKVVPEMPPAAVAQAPVQQALPEPVMVAEAPAQAAMPEWDAFQMAMPRAIQASDLNYGQRQAQAPTGQVNFNRFRAFGAKA